MSYGILLTNADSSTLIDENFYSYVLHSTYAVNPVWTPGLNGTGHYYGSATLPSSVAPESSLPLIVNPAGYTNSSIYETGNGTIFLSVFADNSSPVTIEVYVVRAPSTNNLYGIQVFDQSGNVVFSGEETYLNILDTPYLDGAALLGAPMGTEVTVTFSNPSSKTPCILLDGDNSVGIRYDFGAYMFDWYQVVGKVTSLTTAKFTKILKREPSAYNFVPTVRNYGSSAKIVIAGV